MWGGAVFLTAIIALVNQHAGRCGSCAAKFAEHTSANIPPFFPSPTTTFAPLASANFCPHFRAPVTCIDAPIQYTLFLFLGYPTAYTSLASIKYEH